MMVDAELQEKFRDSFPGQQWGLLHLLANDSLSTCLLWRWLITLILLIASANLTRPGPRSSVLSRTYVIGDD